jgi:hypothetical protein
MRTCPLNSSLFLSWLRLIWMVGEALDVGGGNSDRAASYQEQMSHWVKSGKAQWEHKSSALLPTPDIGRGSIAQQRPESRLPRMGFS